MNSMDLSNYLEKIRYGRKLTQEAFVDGIVSLRQYQRYRNGECEIPYEKVDLFANKLGIPTKKLINEFEREKNLQTRVLNDFYNAVVNLDEKNTERLRAIIQKDIIIEEEKRTFYQHALIIDRFIKKKTTKSEALRENAKLIDYPNILKHAFFGDIEVLILSSLLDLVDMEEHNELLKRLRDLFEEGASIFKGDSDLIYTLILRRLIKSFGIQKNYVDVIRFCDMGLARGMEQKQYFLFENFFYYKALAHFSLEEFEAYADNLFKCYSVLHMEGNKTKIDKFTRWIEKDFNIVFDMFALKHLQKKIK